MEVTEVRRIAKLQARIREVMEVRSSGGKLQARGRGCMKFCRIRVSEDSSFGGFELRRIGKRQTRRGGGMERWRLAAGAVTWRHGALETCCRCADSGGMERWRLAAGVATWRYEVRETCRRCIDRRYGVRETRCRCTDVEVWSAGDALQM